jgi:hypothetical protein
MVNRAVLRRTGVRVFLAAIVLLIVIIISVGAPRVRDYELFIDGFWVGDPTFMRGAGLSEMFLFIGPNKKTGGQWCRQGSLFMASPSRVVTNQCVDMQWSGGVRRWVAAAKSNFFAPNSDVYKVPSAQFEFHEDDAVMPKVMDIGVDVTRGTISLSAGGTLYAFLVKDNEASAHSDWFEDDSEGDDFDEGADFDEGGVDAGIER